MFTAQTFSATFAMLGPIGPTPSIVLRRSFALHIATRTRLPCAESASASAAHTVVFPTPPFPVTMTKRLSASVDISVKSVTHSTGAHAKQRFPLASPSLRMRLIPLGGLGEIGMNCLALEQRG